MKVAFIGGGNLGGNLANLLKSAGHNVVVGLRQLKDLRSNKTYDVALVDDAVIGADVVVLALHYRECAEVLARISNALKGKVVIDATNPLNADWSPMFLGQENSAAEENAKLLPGASLVKAFNTVFADVMKPEKQDRKGNKITVFIAGDEVIANNVASDLARDAGFAPLVCGDLKMSRYIEAMANLNIAIAVGMKGGTNAAFIYDQSQE
jgi:8-hydroxy-5-deazaflavin:NADPH oxidoreductase